MKLPLWVVVLIYLFCWPAALIAAPILVADAGEVRIELFDEPCALKDSVSNLPYRATWTEKGKVYQGCFVPHPNAGIVMAYFDDKTVAAIPIDAFKKVVGI
jgi:hypothetical protein